MKYNLIFAAFFAFGSFLKRILPCEHHFPSHFRVVLNQLDKTVANPGSTLGEAVGALIEREVNRLLRPLTEENDCVYLSAGRINPRTGKATKLLLRDEAGNDYNIDAVIANAQMQPLILIESKYIRYKNTIATKVLGSAPHIIVCGEPFHPCENQSP